MAIEGFGFKEQFLGTSDTAAYTFDFRAYKASHLHIYIQDQYGNILNDTDGEDTTVVASVEFDTENGGGTLTLASNLPNNYVLTILLANDDPDQPTNFPNKFSFTLDVLEGALDFIVACVQRVAYLAQRSVRLHDLDEVDSFDMRLPRSLAESANRFLKINLAGNGFDVGPTATELTDAVALSAAAALASETVAADAASGATTALAEASAAAAAAVASEAAASASAASAAASALAAQASVQLHTGPFTAIAPNANADLTGELTDHTQFTEVDYIARIVRGTTVFARQEFSKFYRNGAWEIAISGDRYADAGADHGVTFTCNSVTGQINAAVANDGGSNAIIDLYKIQWPT